MRTVVVAAGLVVEAGRVLVSRRKTGQHLAGLWELPGGKVEEGEDPRDALARELREELGIETAVGEVADVTFHRYTDADKSVLLLFFHATRLPGSPEPRAVDVAEVAWFGPGDLAPSKFPPADVPVLDKIRRLLS